MQDWRFDDLTRSLGKSTSRRGVLKGLLGGVAAAVVGRSARVQDAGAVGETCSSAALAQCYSDAKANRDANMSACSGNAGEGGGGNSGTVIDFTCKILVDRAYFSALAECDLAQCPRGGHCLDDRCCRGSNCCESGVQCPPNTGFGVPMGQPQFCCEVGESCCGDGCCAAGNTCCRHVSPGLPFGLSDPSSSVSCSDLRSDPKNCGRCGHDCGDLSCIDGKCQCPPDTTTCSSWFNRTCCQSNERCAVNPVTFLVTCAPICGPCEVYSPNDPDGPCVPKECDACQECSPSSGQCVASENGTDCGSGLTCCSGTCVSTICDGSKVFDFDSCTCKCPSVSCPDGETQDPVTCVCGNGGGKGGCPPCQTEGDSGCVPDPSVDGLTCGSCGKCNSGTCVPDVQRSCPTCSTCNAGGICDPEPDNTSCGSNEVCCDGVCTAGTSCGPCIAGYQCPPNYHGEQTCCPNGVECCAPGTETSLDSTCGPTDGVCCPVGTTFQCGTECCDAASETCGYTNDGTGHCCPQGDGLADDGTCCSNDQFCIMVDGSTICCPSGQQCAVDPKQTVSMCCDTPYADSDGNCCAANFAYAHCADGSYICCDPNESDAVCCANHGGA